jgi:surface antigen
MSRTSVMPERVRRPRRRAASFALIALAASTVLMGLNVESAQAAGSIPFGAGTGVTAACVTGATTTFTCDYGGYNGKAAQESSATWSSSTYWSYGNAVSGTNGTVRHNCTTYIQFRLMQNHTAYPGWHAGAGGWAAAAARAGSVVNQTPTVGSVAEYTAGHVAYVEQVNKDWIITTSDNLDHGTNRLKISRTSPYWPDSFIHINDITPLHLSYDSALPYNFRDQKNVVHTGVHVSGWAFDLANVTQPVTVRVSIDNPFKLASVSTQDDASKTSAAANAKYKEYGVSTSHGFSIDLDANVRGQHTAYVEIVSLSGKTVLSKGSKTFTVGNQTVEDLPVFTDPDDTTGADPDGSAPTDDDN